MNQNRVDRRKQIVPRPAWLDARKHRDAVKAAKESRDREKARQKAASYIQQWYKSRLRRPHVFMQGGDLNHVTLDTPIGDTADYARYGLLRDFLRNRGEDTLRNDYMRYFQKVYTDDDRYGEFVLKVPFPEWMVDAEWMFDDPNDRVHPSRTISKSKAKEAVNRRRRRLRDIEGGDIVIRDALFRELPDRGRRFKNSPKTKRAPPPFYYF